jgi:hypothetical protein
MDRTLREHISFLEQRIKRLSEEGMNSVDLEERNRIEAEIRAATLALSHYREALQLEKSLS